jgi:hypothetical protein
MKILSLVAILEITAVSQLLAAESALAVDSLSKTPDVTAAANAVAIDYVKLVSIADAGDLKAFGLLVWLTENAGFDGASSEAHAEILWRLIQRLGDEKVMTTLSKFEDVTLLGLAGAVWGVNGIEFTSEEEFPQEQFVKSPRVISHLQKVIKRKSESSNQTP